MRGCPDDLLTAASKIRQWHVIQLWPLSFVAFWHSTFDKRSQSRFNCRPLSRSFGGRPFGSSATRRFSARAILRSKRSPPIAQPPLLAARRSVDEGFVERAAEQGTIKKINSDPTFYRANADCTANE